LIVVDRRNGRSPITEHYPPLHSPWSNIVKSVYLAMSSPMEVDCLFEPVIFPGRTFSHLSFSLFHLDLSSENAFFSSPTIRYAAQDHYATPLKFTSQLDKRVYTAKFVLRCRQMPGTFSIHRQTVNNSSMSDLCDFISDDEIEWKTSQRGTVIFDGVCLRLVEDQTGNVQCHRRLVHQSI
jgi:hypothetical protein